MCLKGNCREPFPSKNLKQSHFGYCYVPVTGTLYFVIIFLFSFLQNIFVLTTAKVGYIFIYFFS